MFIKTIFCPDGVTLPYSINTEKPKMKIGIFGDSFAALAEEAQRNKVLYEQNDKLVFNHEGTWPYFLSNIMNASTHTYGIMGAGMVDITNTIVNSEKIYDLYLIFHTAPLRKSIIPFKEVKDTAYTSKHYYEARSFLSGKKVIDIYWDTQHMIKNFSKNKEYINNYHRTNPNTNEVRPVTEAEKNPLDIMGSYHHMSSRGNLLFALDLYKHIKGEVALG